jgi:hypothetical protein
MGEALVKFDEIEEKIKQQMKESFLNMIPEESWDRLAREYLGKNGKNIIEPILKDELTKFYKDAIARWVMDRRTELDEMIHPSLGMCFADACDNMSKNILNEMTKQTAHAVLNIIQNGAKTCNQCNVQVAFGLDNCPRCGNYVS